MTEPDVTLTDYVLAVECAILAWCLNRVDGSNEALRKAFILFFAAIGFAAMTGGSVHGFFPDERTTGYAVLWSLTLIAIGAART